MTALFFRLNVFPSTLVLLTALLIAAPASADAVRDCKTSKEVNEKVRACTLAISRTNDPRQLERLYLRRGNAHMELKLYAEAKRDFTRLIALNPSIAGYFDNRMYASRELGQMQDAVADANREVALAPNMAFTYRSRGLLLEKMLDYGRALQDFDQAAAIAPMDNGVIIDRARIKSKLGRGGEAIQELSAVIARDPSNLWAYRERGLAYVLIGDSINAEQDLILFARTSPDDEEVRTTLAIIRGHQIESSAPKNSAERQQPNYSCRFNNPDPQIAYLDFVQSRFTYANQSGPLSVGALSADFTTRLGYTLTFDFGDLRRIAHEAPQHIDGTLTISKQTQAPKLPVACMRVWQEDEGPH